MEKTTDYDGLRIESLALEACDRTITALTVEEVGNRRSGYLAIICNSLKSAIYLQYQCREATGAGPSGADARSSRH